MSADVEHDNYIAGLRALADFIECYDDLPLSAVGNILPVTFCFWGDDAKERLAEFARRLPGSKSKGTREGSYGDAYFDIEGSLRGIKVQGTAFRHAVCTRVVKGAREITEEVPDPDAPKVTVTKTVEDVEWVCAPLLAEATS